MSEERRLSSLQRTNNRDHEGHLTRLERAGKPLVADQLWQIFSSETLEVMKPGVVDSEVSVKMGQASSEILPGTFIRRCEFVEFLNHASGQTKMAEADQLVGQGKGDVGNPIFTAKRRNGRVEVYAGSNCDEALTISRIGDKGEFGDEERQEYQEAYFGISRPLLTNPPVETKSTFGLDNDPRPVFCIDEDCGATMVTLGSVLELTGGVRNLFSVIEINVGAMTPQAVIGLIQQLEEGDTPWVIKVGFMGWGLSEGIGSNKDHQNYVTLVDEYTSLAEATLALGDVGEGGRRIKKDTPWERYARDDYWSREQAKKFTWLELGRGSVVIGLAYGGLMMGRFRSAAGGQEENATSWMTRAWRVNKGGHFHAAFSDFLEPLDQIRKQYSNL